MADVVQIARDRRKWLAAEIAKLDEFIQTAEALMKWHESQGAKTSEGGDKVIGQSTPMTLRTGSGAGATSAGAA